MSTTEGLTKAIGCLSTTFPEFLAKEIARLVDAVMSATQAITDPLAAIADTNVQGIVDDVATLADGNNLDNIGAIGDGIIRSFATVAIREELEAMAEAYPNRAKKVLDALNKGESVMAAALIMFSLFREAPYVAAQKICESIERLAQRKIDNLQCLKKHITQMTNCVAALAKAKNQIVNFPYALDDLSAYLADAQRELETSLLSPLLINETALSAAKTALQNGDQVLDPQSSDLSLLDVANILTSGTTSAQHITESNIKLASMALPHLSYYLEVEMAAIANLNGAINFQLENLARILTSFRSAAVSNRALEIRRRTINDIIERVWLLKARVDEARQSNSTRLQTAESLLWSSRLKSIISMVDKVQSSAFTEGSSEGLDRANELSQNYDDLIFQINQINSDHVVSGVDDVSDLAIKVTSIRKSGNHLLKILDSKTVTDSEMLTFTTLVAATATGGNNRIEESITASRDLQEACQAYLAEDIGFRKDFDRLLELFEAIGWDRARDMIDTGDFEAFFSASLDGMSYLTTTISCLGEAINGVDDINTKNEIAQLRDDLMARRSNQILTAADNLNFGATKILDDARAQLEEFEKRKQTALNLVEKLTDLYESIGGNLDALGTAIDETYKAVKANKDKLRIDSKGDLSDALNEFIRRPNVGTPQTLC